jgi:hypothetical protein
VRLRGLLSADTLREVGVNSLGLGIGQGLSSLASVTSS